MRLSRTKVGINTVKLFFRNNVDVPQTRRTILELMPAMHTLAVRHTEKLENLL